MNLTPKILRFRFTKSLSKRDFSTEGRRWIMKRHFNGMPTRLEKIEQTKDPKLYTDNHTDGQTDITSWSQAEPGDKSLVSLSFSVRDDFDLVSEPLPALKDGEIMIKSAKDDSRHAQHKLALRPEFWSVDPYARIYPISFGYKLPMTMLGSQVTSDFSAILNCHHSGQVSEVVDSRNPLHPVGSHVLAYTGWKELAVVGLLVSGSYKEIYNSWNSWNLPYNSLTLRWTPWPAMTPMGRVLQLFLKYHRLTPYLLVYQGG